MDLPRHILEYTGTMRKPMSRLRRALSAALLLAPMLPLGWTALGAQGPPPSSSPSPAPAAPLNRDAIVNHLNAAIGWYRDSTSKVESPGEPSDVIYQDNAQNFAAQALKLAFQSAREEAEIIAIEEQGAHGDDSEQNSGASGQPNYARVQATLSARMMDLQSQINALDKQIDRATGAARQTVIANRDALQGQLDLYKSMQDAVQKMANFAEANEANNAGLTGTINTLARSVPGVLVTSKADAAPKPAPPAQPRSANTAGLIGQIVALYGQLADMHSLDGMVTQTNRLREAADAVRKPLRDNLVATIRAGNATISDTPAGQTPPGQSPSQQNPPPQNQAASSPGTQVSVAEVQKRYRDLSTKFRSYSDAMVPLAQEMDVLDQSRLNFQEWRRSIARESYVTLQSLLTRVVGIALALGAVFLLSELWRRLTFRYVRDARRRRQILVLRRFVSGFLFGIVIILGFVSEFSSLATFAGFVTAGIAVGLQTVLLSVAAYFFVIGRYGIRVGDRISISGVTGDVIDIGLVRLYIMELAGPAVDLYPTGRIVVFSNSVLFQATTPLFKQLPGTDYTWHEVVLELGSGGNHKAVQDKVGAAVNSVFEKYRADIEGQSSYVEGRIELQLKSPTPESKLQFSDAGLELLVRYPVLLRKEAQIDDHMTAAIIDLINGDSELKAAVTGSPKIRAAVRT